MTIVLYCNRFGKYIASQLVFKDAVSKLKLHSWAATCSFPWPSCVFKPAVVKSCVACMDYEKRSNGTTGLVG